MTLLGVLDAQQVAVFDTFAVPRFVAMFGALALEMLLPCERAVVANIGCRSGFPDQIIPRYLPGATIIGFDPCEPAIELARAKAAIVRDAVLDYRLVDDLPLPVPDQSFSHAMTIIPLVDPLRRTDIVREMARLLDHGGQAIYALPLRGSYPELIDLLREYALKHDADDLAKALEANAMQRPTVETFADVFEEHGLVDVDVEVHPATLSFRSGLDFFEDPVTRLLVLPDLQLTMGTVELGAALQYAREAIDKYWSEGDFELSIHVGCASARKVV